VTVYVTLAVDDELYALPVDAVIEIAEAEPVAPVPGAGGHLLGVRNLRGEVLPVFSLARVLGRAGDGPQERHVVIDYDGRRAGLVVDRVDDVGPLAGELEELESPLLAGAALGGGRLIGVLDLPLLIEKLEARA
jgi:purine-binding chemotaxis protein CheW